jgi:hypothetical protein
VYKVGYFQGHHHSNFSLAATQIYVDSIYLTSNLKYP